VNRYQIVAYKEFWSIPFHVSSGVPQGSHLAPILFLIFVNDITCQNSFILMFADDVKIYRKINCRIEAELLQFDVNALYTWCLNNNFTLNIKKCQVMTFTKARAVINFDYDVNGEMLQRTMGPVKDLGILFDPKLKFDCYIR